MPCAAGFLFRLKHSGYSTYNLSILVGLNRLRGPLKFLGNNPTCELSLQPKRYGSSKLAFFCSLLKNDRTPKARNEKHANSEVELSENLKHGTS